MKIERIWAMPNKDTFSVQPIADFIRRYYQPNTTAVDPFARDNRYGLQWANDLNPACAAPHHQDALDFLQTVYDNKVAADLVFFDPPYSPRQIKECYDGIGLKMRGEEAWRTNGWKKERDLINEIVKVGGIVLSFGWNSAGMGRERGFDIEEIVLVCHGSGHSDTICMAERKTVHQVGLFPMVQTHYGSGSNFVQQPQQSSAAVL